MKKFIVLCLAGLLILAFSAPGYAQAPKLEFKASGYIDAQTFLDVNVPQRNTSAGMYSVVNPNYSRGSGVFGVGSSGWNKTDSHWDGRAHLRFDAVMDKNLSGTIYFEIDAMRYGGSAGSTYGAPGGYLTQAADKNNFGCWTTDKAAVEVKNIYFDVGLPYFGIPVPMTVRIGAQPIGVRPHIMVYSDGAGITGGIKVDPVTIAPMWAKLGEYSDFAADDADFYGLHVNAKVSTFTIGGYGLYYNMNTYPLYYGTGVSWLSTMTGSPSTFTTSSSYGLIIPGTQSAHMWWFGAYADGKAGPVNLNFDFVYDFGSVHERLTLNIPDVRYQGWATRLMVDYPWQKFNFGVVGMYATGPDARHTSTTGLPGSTTNMGTYSKSLRGYVVPPGSEQDTSNNESIVVYGMENGASGGVGIAKNTNSATMCRGGFGGTWFAKLYGSVKATPWYKVTLQGLYIGDTTTHGNTLGNAVKVQGSTLLRDDSTVGLELDLINELQIYNNLKFIVGAGRLFAGDALDINNGSASGRGVNRAAANPWAVRTRLMYTF